MDDNTLKIGDKGRHLVVPDGWHKVRTGNPCKGDMFADLTTAKWMPVNDWDLTDPMPAEDYFCLIRRNPQ